LAREFGEKVVALSERSHVWLVDSLVNRAAAEPVWASLKRTPPAEALARGVTIFQASHEASLEELADILETIVEHHPLMTVLEVYGLRDRHVAERALAGIRFVVSNSESDRVVAVKHSEG
jgi:hypothetical protein